MPNLYCTGCKATVVVTAGSCPAGHVVSISSGSPSQPGRHRAPGRAGFPSNRKRPSRVKPKSRPVPVTTVQSTTPARPAFNPVRLPLVEMFGFDDTDEVLETIDYEPVPAGLGHFGPKQAIVNTAPPKRETLNVFNSMPSLAEIGTVSAGENTGTLIAKLWQATDTLDPIASTNWSDEPASHASRFGESDRRWGVIAVAAIAVVALVFASIRLTSNTQAVVDFGPTSTALAQATATTTDLRAIAGFLADPAADPADLSNAAVVLTSLDATTRSLASEASALAGFDGQQTTASFIESVATQGQQIESRVGSALSYRLIANTMFEFPILPAATDSAGAADLAFEMSGVIADAENSLSRLPRDIALSQHRLATEVLITDLVSLTEIYIEALRSSDTLVAANIGTDIQQRVTSHESLLNTVMANFEAEVTAQIDDYERSLEAAADLTGS